MFLEENAPDLSLTCGHPHGVIARHERLLMDMFGNVKLVELSLLITKEQKAWLEMMVKKGKIAVPPGGTLPEGSVISIFLRTMLWNSEEQRQSIDGLPEEMIEEFRQQSGLVEIAAQISEDQKAWLDKVAAISKVAPLPGDSITSIFTRVLLQNAMEQQQALERADPWADDDEM
jgi:hypothetical protein